MEDKLSYLIDLEQLENDRSKLREVSNKINWNELRAKFIDDLIQQRSMFRNEPKIENDEMNMIYKVFEYISKELT